MALRDAGWGVVNFACSLGRPPDRARRRAELLRAGELAGFKVVIAEPPAAISGGDDLGFAQRTLAQALAGELTARRPQLVVGPSPHDAHPGHEVVGRAICDAVESIRLRRDVMFWGLWGELAIANVLVGFGAARLAEIQRALAAHAGELARNRYDQLLVARAQANAILGPERVFGFGSPGGPYAYAELLMHVAWSPPDGWRLAAAREFDPARPAGEAAGAPIEWWLRARSITDA